MSALRNWIIGGSVAVVGAVGVGLAIAQEYKSGLVWPEPPLVIPAPLDNLSAPPSDAVVLFDGKSLDAWKDGKNWEIKDGYAIGRKSIISTIQEFGDVQLHLEFATPEKVDPKQTGQNRGNNGVFFMGKYEVQILDSFENPTYFDGQCGAVYKQQPPMVNVCRKPGEWQTYDIVFEAPKFAEATEENSKEVKVLKPAICTVFHNGVCVQNHYELKGGTFYDQPYHYEKHAEKLPFRLQNHGNPVKFRNIWVRDIAMLVGKEPEKKD